MMPLPVRCVAPDESTERAIRRLCLDFCWLVDHGFADQTRHLFTDDVRYVSQGVESVGIEALMERMRARATQKHASRHQVSNVRLHRRSGREVEACSMLVVYRGLTTPSVVADVHDLFRVSAHEDWRIAQRQIVTVFEAQKP